MKTIIESFRIKAVEPIKMTTREERLEILKRASWKGSEERTARLTPISPVPA